MQLSENVLLIKKLSSKYAKFWAETPHFGKICGKFGATVISFVGNLQLSIGNLPVYQ